MRFSLIDTHAHFNLPAFKDDGKEVIARCLEEGIGVINVGTNYSTSVKAVDLAQEFPEGLWAAVGLHPLHLEEAFSFPAEVFDSEKYFQLIQSSSRVVAIGEIGLDYGFLPSEKGKAAAIREKQKRALGAHFALAEKVQRPVIIHCRDAFPELIAFFQERRGKIFSGVVHCFTGDWEEAQFFLGQGFYLGLNGIIFKTDLDEVISKIPLERILVETDCPYLPPPQKKGERNTSLNLKFIVQKIADSRGISWEKVARATTENAQRLFSLSAPPFC